MLRHQKLSQKCGNQWTMIGMDQAIYALAHVDMNILSTVILIIGSFHQTHNYVKAISKLMIGVELVLFRRQGNTMVLQHWKTCKLDYYQESFRDWTGWENKKSLT